MTKILGYSLLILFVIAAAWFSQTAVDAGVDGSYCPDGMYEIARWEADTGIFEHGAEDIGIEYLTRVGNEVIGVGWFVQPLSGTRVSLMVLKAGTETFSFPYDPARVAGDVTSYVETPTKHAISNLSWCGIAVPTSIVLAGQQVRVEYGAARIAGLFIIAFAILAIVYVIAGEIKSRKK
jgi:hypothetical protein